MPQTLLLFKGPMGIGKSTLSRVLGKDLGWPVVDKDDASDVLMKTLDGYGPIAYSIMFKQAESLLIQGFNVIIDSPLRGEPGLQNALTIAKKTRADVRVLNCLCSDTAAWKMRLETRTRRPAHILKTWQDFEHYWETAAADFDYDIEQPTLSVDTRLALEENLERVKMWLN